MKKPDTFKKITLLLTLVVLLPALFYSVYEINSLTRSEELIAEIYAQQLDAILYSLNQHTLDIVNSWASNISTLIEDRRSVSREHLQGAFDQFFQRNPSVRAVFFADTLLNAIRVLTRQEGSGATPLDQARFLEELRRHRVDIERLSRYRRADYRKIETIGIPGTDTAESDVALLFVSNDRSGNSSLAGVVIKERAFVRAVLAPKLLEAASGEFIIAVMKKGEQQPVFATDSLMQGGLRQKKDLWLIHDHEVGIRLKGATIEELIRARFYRNLGLIVLLDLVLIAGVWIVYRNIRRALELVRLKSDFVSNVSHELRTPLSLIRMFAETLEMGRVQSEQRKQEYYATIVRETERLTRLVNNILDFSKMEAGKKKYQFTDIDLNGVVSSVLNTYSYHLQSEGFTPLVTLEPHLPSIRADTEAVTEAIVNVLDNAVKYSGAEKYLRVCTGMSDGFAFVEVEDHGIGIALEHQQRVFETFYRVSSGLVHNTRGSGLGLALVKHIMLAHNGSTTVYSAAGKGSTFRLLFPLTSEVSSHAKAAR